MKREVLLKWHPDKETQFVLEGHGTKEEFQQESKAHTDAISFVQRYLEKRG